MCCLIFVKPFHTLGYFKLSLRKSAAAAVSVMIESFWLCLVKYIFLSNTPLSKNKKCKGLYCVTYKVTADIWNAKLIP